jgi:hypothetical protein
MRSRPVLAFTLLAGIPALASAQIPSNEITMSNGGDAFLLPPSPSVAGDLYWRALPGDRVLAHQHGPAGVTTMEISGFYEELFDTDWSTTPLFFDRLIGPAVPAPGAPCALQPDLASPSGVSVLLGPSGFGSPCTVAPSLCSPGGCPTTGFGPIGWLLEVSFGTTVVAVLPADGTPASDAAVTYFVTPGMPATGGACGLGDFVFQTVYSTDETQADDCSGLNAFSGFATGGGPLTQDTPAVTPAFSLAWREPVLNVVADSGTGLGVEHGPNGGGALNGLKLDTQGGAATIGVEVRDFEGLGDLAYAWSTPYPAGSAGLTVGSAWLLQRFNRLMPACFLGSIAATTFVFTAEGAFTTCQIPLQAVASGPVELYWQAFLQDPLTGALRNTNRVRTTLY